MNLTQLTVLITGGATGIGFALARKFHSAGNLVILVGRSETAMNAGRGRGKISSAQLAEEFWEGFKDGRYEMFIGKSKLLYWVNRLVPSVAERIVRRGI